MNETYLYLWLAGLGVLAGSLLKMVPRSGPVAAALNLIPAIGWLVGAGGT
jgi:hypothetical protein